MSLLGDYIQTLGINHTPPLKQLCWTEQKEYNSEDAVLESGIRAEYSALVHDPVLYLFCSHSWTLVTYRLWEGIQIKDLGLSHVR